MNIRLSITILITKIAIKFLRLTRSGGTTLPGKIALKLYPDIASVISKDFNIIMVTGTNGKTTTTRIIGQMLSENSIPYITNKSGANLVSGVISTFIESVDINGRCDAKTALIEIDEAAFKAISSLIKPNFLVVTNFFRDQLDRYGELYSTLNGVREGILKSKHTKLILNADDSLCASLGKDTGNETVYFGMSETAIKEPIEALSQDAVFCIYCKEKYVYKSRVYGHLGSFACPGCGYSRPKPSITCESVIKLTSAFSDIVYTVPSVDGTSSYSAKINLPGLYNVYNALAAASLGFLLDLPQDKTIKALESFECGFGRMETINIGNKFIKLILVKNPTGFNQVLNYLVTDDKKMQLAFAINDNYADGTDISWLWDVDFEKLEEYQDQMVNIYTSGTRAEDMSVRLKYAGIFSDRITTLKDYKELIREGISKTDEGECFYILPTYTAMLDIRKILSSMYNLKEFWK
ncbi:MAG TPA: MurT ligase domain-containing protein [Clostridia bacterium]